MRHPGFYPCLDVVWDVEAERHAGIGGPFCEETEFVPGVG